jgi:hypothetical protein
VAASASEGSSSPPVSRPGRQSRPSSCPYSPTPSLFSSKKTSRSLCLALLAVRQSGAVRPHQIVLVRDGRVRGMHIGGACGAAFLLLRCAGRRLVVGAGHLADARDVFDWIVSCVNPTLKNWSRMSGFSLTVNLRDPS